MVESISIGYKLLGSIGLSDYYHAFLIYTDKNGKNLR